MHFGEETRLKAMMMIITTVPVGSVAWKGWSKEEVKKKKVVPTTTKKRVRFSVVEE